MRAQQFVLQSSVEPDVAQPGVQFRGFYMYLSGQLDVGPGYLSVLNAAVRLNYADAAVFPKHSR